MGKPKCSETNIFEKPKKFNDYYLFSVVVVLSLSSEADSREDFFSIFWSVNFDFPAV